MRKRLLLTILATMLAGLACPVMAGSSSSSISTFRERATLPAEIASSPLRNTYWKLVRLNDAPVTVADNQREPHLMLSMREPRLSGNGGCNALTGGFELEDDTQLRFTGIASTRMACPEGMAQEALFLKTLDKVASYRLVGESLEMLDAQGAVVARFVAVALR